MLSSSHLDMNVIVGETRLELPPALRTIRHGLVIQDLTLRNIVGELLSMNLTS